MPLKLSNNAIGTLVSSMTNSSTSVVLAPGQVAKFPDLVAGEWFPITVVRASEPTQFEIMHVTARSGDVLTVTRAREGTVAITFSVGDIVEHRLTSGALDRDFVRLGPDSLESVRFIVAADGSNLKATVHADGKEEELARQKDIDSLGTAATRDVGTEPNEIPTNDDLGSAAFLDISIDDLQWLGTPIGGYITPFSPPPKDDPRFRYILCTAGETGSGGYNEGVLTGETVTGSGATVLATAVVNLQGSPMHGQTVHLINTESRFVGAGLVEGVESDMMQKITGGFNVRGNASSDSFKNGAFSGSGYTDNRNWIGSSASLSQAQIRFDSANSPGARTGDRTQPKTHRLPHYRRIL